MLTAKPRLKTAFLSLGSNLGDREENLRRALQRLQEAGASLTQRSSLYETEPQDLPDQPWFVNIVAEVQTAAFPRQFLASLQAIERAMGRNRAASVPKGPRLIDVDILLFGTAHIQTPELTIPHPRMYSRRFVLEPLLEISPDLRDPVSKKRLSHFLRAVDFQKVRRL